MYASIGILLLLQLSHSQRSEPISTACFSPCWLIFKNTIGWYYVLPRVGLNWCWSTTSSYANVQPSKFWLAPQICQRSKFQFGFIDGARTSLLVDVEEGHLRKLSLECTAERSLFWPSSALIASSLANFSLGNFVSKNARTLHNAITILNVCGHG